MRRCNSQLREFFCGFGIKEWYFPLSCMEFMSDYKEHEEKNVKISRVEWRWRKIHCQGFIVWSKVWYLDLRLMIWSTRFDNDWFGWQNKRKNITVNYIFEQWSLLVVEIACLEVVSSCIHCPTTPNNVGIF